MNFKVGQRVRIIKSAFGNVGRETTITACEMRRHRLAPQLVQPCYRLAGMDGHSVPVNVAGEYLAPLTDPGADAFMERMKNLKPLDTFTEHFAEVWRELTGREA